MFANCSIFFVKAACYLPVDFSLRALYINLEQTIARSGNSFKKEEKKTIQTGNVRSGIFQCECIVLLHFFLTIVLRVYGICFKFDRVLSRNNEKELKKKVKRPLVQATTPGWLYKRAILYLSAREKKTICSP